MLVQGNPNFKRNEGPGASGIRFNTHGQSAGRCWKNMAQDPLRYSNMDIIPDQNAGLIWFSGKNMEEIQVMEQHTIRFWL